MIYTTLVTFLCGSYALRSIGSNRNQLLEGYVCAATLSSISLICLLNLGDIPVRIRGLSVAVLLMSFTILFPASQLIFFDKIGKITLGSQREDAERKLFAAYIKTLSKPLFIEDRLFALPWHAADNRYPAVAIDDIVYYSFKTLSGGGVPGLMVRKHFRSVLVEKESNFYKAAINAGYEPKPLPERLNFTKLKLLILEEADMDNKRL